MRKYAAALSPPGLASNRNNSHRAAQEVDTYYLRHVHGHCDTDDSKSVSKSDYRHLIRRLESNGAKDIL
jgi:hypothetical protein